jgi:hypothetical protein
LTRFFPIAISLVTAMHAFKGDEKLMGRTQFTAITLSALLVMGGGTQPAVAGDLSMEDAKTIAAYPLTMDKVQRKFAAAADLARLSAADPALQTQLESINEAKGLDAQIKAFSAVPKAAAAMQAHGISARDYSLTTLAVNYAQVPQVPAQYLPANVPPTPSMVAAPPEHVAFVKAHLDEIHQLTQAIMQARKGTEH